jgi:hypothetical protein
MTARAHASFNCGRRRSLSPAIPHIVPPRRIYGTAIHANELFERYPADCVSGGFRLRAIVGAEGSPGSLFARHRRRRSSRTDGCGSRTSAGGIFSTCCTLAAAAARGRG